MKLPTRGITPQALGLSEVPAAPGSAALILIRPDGKPMTGAQLLFVASRRVVGPAARAPKHEFSVEQQEAIARYAAAAEAAKQERLAALREREQAEGPGAKPQRSAAPERPTRVVKPEKAKREQAQAVPGKQRGGLPLGATVVTLLPGAPKIDLDAKRDEIVAALKAAGGTQTINQLRKACGKPVAQSVVKLVTLKQVAIKEPT